MFWEFYQVVFLYVSPPFPSLCQGRWANISLGLVFGILQWMNTVNDIWEFSARKLTENNSCWELINKETILDRADVVLLLCNVHVFTETWTSRTKYERFPRSRRERNQLPLMKLWMVAEQVKYKTLEAFKVGERLSKFNAVTFPEPQRLLVAD